MADETVKVTETTKEYELQKADLVPSAGEDEPTWANKIAGQLDRFRVIPRLIMLAYIYAFYSSTTWFMALSDPTNAQAAFISTIVGAGAAFFGLYVGKPGTSLPKGKKQDSSMADDFSAVTKQLIEDRQARQKELEAQKELLSKMATELESAGMKAEDNAQISFSWC